MARAYTQAKIAIKGYDGNVPNTFYLQNADTNKLALVFPGIGYTCQMPLLYYTTNVLLALNFDVLWVEYEYKKNERWSTLSEEEQVRWLSQDANAAYLAAISQRRYSRLVLVGKSVGTGAVSAILAKQKPLENERIVWFTPLLADEEIYGTITSKCKGNSLFIQGTKDPYFVKDRLEEVKRLGCGDVMIIDGADHSLELEGKDTSQTARALELIIDSVGKFVKG